MLKIFKIIEDLTKNEGEEFFKMAPDEWDEYLEKAVFEITVINAQKIMYKKCLEESIKMNGGVEPKIYTEYKNLIKKLEKYDKNK